MQSENLYPSQNSFSDKIQKLFCPSITATKIWFFEKPKTKPVLVYYYERSYKMFKAFKLSSIIFLAVMFILTLSFSALQACVVLPGKPLDEQCKGEASVHQYAKIMKVACGLCKDTEESGDAKEVAQHTADVVLNIRGMTCAGCEGKVKDVLSAFEGVSDVEVSHKDGKAQLHVEEGKVDKAVLIEALKQVGFLASEGK